MYVWVDGIHFNVRLEEDRLCLLVMLGARADGTKELIAVEDGYRESKESWETLLRGLKKRGLRARWSRSATARWASGARCARCGRRRASSAAGCIDWPTCSTSCPSACRASAKQALHEIMAAETRADAERASHHSRPSTRRSTRRGSTSLTPRQGELLTFFDFPAEHWKHLRTTNSSSRPSRPCGYASA